MQVIDFHCIMVKLCSVATNLLCFDLWFVVICNPKSALHILRCDYCGRHIVIYPCWNDMSRSPSWKKLWTSLWRPAYGVIGYVHTHWDEMESTFLLGLWEALNKSAGVGMLPCSRLWDCKSVCMLCTGPGVTETQSRRCTWQRCYWGNPCLPQQIHWSSPGVSCL